MIVLDASVLISYLDGDVSHHSAAQSLLVKQSTTISGSTANAG